jgi:hypothetical protein
MNWILILTILLILFIGLSIFLFIKGYNLVKRMEMLDDITDGIFKRDIETKETLNSLLKQMRDIDIRGSFESDDEVGSVFKELQELIKNYNEI